ncbi:hypothetical protein [Natranaerobius trueperi]|nr:hypothetical protein [Natranaerobius trueperi]
MLDKDAGGIIGIVKAGQKGNSSKKIIIQGRTFMGGVSVINNNSH